MTRLRAEEIVGRRLDSIQYDIFEWDSPPEENEAVHVVPGGVVLNFQERVYALRWELQPPSEQLVVEMGDVLAAEPLMRRVDVSSSWSTFVGAELLAATWSYHETGDGVQPWAITLTFGQAGDIVIALGELSDGSLHYSPDSLIVTAAVEVARFYQPPAALGSAWSGVGDDPRRDEPSSARWLIAMVENRRQLCTTHRSGSDLCNVARIRLCNLQCIST